MNEVRMDQQDPSFSLTPEQQTLLEQLSPTATCGEALRWLNVVIDGDLDPQRLQVAFDTLLAQQPMLLARLGKVAGFHGWRQAAASAARFPLTVQVSEQRAEDIQAQIKDSMGRAFVLGESESLQAGLYRLAPRQWQLVLGIARCSADGQSLNLLLEQVQQAYAGIQGVEDAPGSSPNTWNGAVRWCWMKMPSPDAPTGSNTCTVCRRTSPRRGWPHAAPAVRPVQATGACR